MRQSTPHGAIPIPYHIVLVPYPDLMFAIWTRNESFRSMSWVRLCNAGKLFSYCFAISGVNSLGSAQERGQAQRNTRELHRAELKKANWVSGAAIG
jgi:hypothetical protein